MPRPQSITDEEILAAARAVFLDKGIAATVEDVAARCGVGEATIFRRFPTKQALIWAVMDMDADPPWVSGIEERCHGDDVRAALVDLAQDILHFGRKVVPFLMMRMSHPGMAHKGPRPARALRAIAALRSFFEVQIQSGRVRPRDPHVAARIWMGSLQHFIMFEAFTKTPNTISDEDFIEGLVDLFCEPLKKGRKG